MSDLENLNDLSALMQPWAEFADSQRDVPGKPETVVLQDGEWVCVCCFEPAPDLTAEMMAPAVSTGSAHVVTRIEHASTCVIGSAGGGGHGDS